MKTKNFMIIILLVSIIGFSAGLYFKFIKAYSNEKLQVQTARLNGAQIQRQLKLGEMISLLEGLKETVIQSNNLHAINVDNNNDVFSENERSLKKLKLINYVSIAMMIITLILAIVTLRKLGPEK